jgi:hypothetical protein
MDEIYFLVRYTPFWSIPIFIIFGEFAYIFWIRKKKKFVFAFGLIALFALFSSIMYYMSGGPEKSVQKVIDLVWYFTR